MAELRRRRRPPLFDGLTIKVDVRFPPDMVLLELDSAGRDLTVTVPANVEPKMLTALDRQLAFKVADAIDSRAQSVA